MHNSVLAGAFFVKGLILSLAQRHGWHLMPAERGIRYQVRVLVRNWTEKALTVPKRREHIGYLASPETLAGRAWLRLAVLPRLVRRLGPVENIAPSMLHWSMANCGPEEPAEAVDPDQLAGRLPCTASFRH